jgi:TP901 family phage tail tape measure protein
MSTSYVVGVKIDGNAASYLRATQQAQQGTTSFVSKAKAEFQRLKSFMQSYQGQLAGLGLSGGLVAMAANAAKLERTLTQVSLTAGMSVTEQSEAYKKMFEMIKRNGGVMEDTVAGFNSLVQAGLKYKEAMNATDAISDAQAVTGANSSVLAGALSVGAANFNLDLSKLGVAALMLDKMTASGRMGNAELENLASILPRIASRARGAGMDLDKTLAFTQAMSQIEKQPERLATLVDSSLRLFSTINYAKDAEKATGVQMFGKKGERRDAVAVLEDMRKKYKLLTTDAQRFAFMGKAFGKADLDTQRGMSSALSGEMLEKMREFDKLSRQADGTILRDKARATNNAATQAERLKNTLREAAEGFARPINQAVANAIKYLLDAKKDGGLGLSGGQIAGGAAAGAVGLYFAARFLPDMVVKVLGRGAGLAAGVAEGKALQAAAGVTPVYVTNWAEMNGGGTGSAGGLLGTGGAAAGGAAAVGLLAKLRNLVGAGLIVGNAPLGVAGAGAVAGGAALAGAAGYGIGTGINKLFLEGNGAGDAIGEVVARFMSMLGSQEAAQALAINDALKNTKVGGELTLRVFGDSGLTVRTDAKPLSGTRINTSLGQTNLAAGH